jgi:transposase
LEMFKTQQANKFGKKSEKTNIGQISLFNEVEMTSDEHVKEESFSKEIKSNGRKGAKKKPSLKDSELEVEIIIHDMEDTEGLERIGEDTKEILKYSPARYYIERHVYPTYKKEREDGTTSIVSEPREETVIPKSYASAELISHVIKQKYDMGLPLYRIEQDFIKNRIPFSRQTMSNWVIYVGENMFINLWERLKLQLLQEDIIHADETTLNVLHHQDGSTNDTSYMWVYCSGEHGKQIRIYDYQPDRKQERAVDFLTGFHGYLNCDGYSAYDNVPDITKVACLAHARRKFTDAIKGMSSENSEAKDKANHILRKMNYIFKLDKEAAKKESLEEKQEYRQTIIKPVMDELKNTVLEIQPRILEKSALGKAISYTLKQFSYVENVFSDPRLEFTNNRAERVVKPFVMGRKAFLFSNTTRGANVSATIYSVVESAKANKLHVERYLTYVMDEMKGKTVNNVDQFDYLLPTSKTLPITLYTSKKNTPK